MRSNDFLRLCTNKYTILLVLLLTVLYIVISLFEIHEKINNYTSQFLKRKLAIQFSRNSVEDLMYG